MDTQRFEELLVPRQLGTPQSRPFDIVFLGATLSNLASALALASHYEGLKLRVYEEEKDFFGPDFIVTLSKKSWDALSLICPSPEQALIPASLNEDSQVAFTNGVAFATSHRLLGLFISKLPANSLVLGALPASVCESPEGTDLKMQNGSEVRTKLLVGDFFSLKDVNQLTNYTEVNFRISGGQTCFDGCTFEGSSAYAECQKMDGASQIVGGVFRKNGVEKLVDYLRQFPGLYKMVLESKLEHISSKELLVSPSIFSGHGRSTFLSCPFRVSPCISTQMCEMVLDTAALIKECVSQKGLTPAALRELERLQQNKRKPKDITSNNEDLIGHWGLMKDKTVSEPQSFMPSLTPKKRLSFDLSRGLVSLTPREGMGWRILT